MDGLHLAVDGRSWEPRPTGVGVYLRHLMEAMLAAGRGHRFTFFHLPGGDRPFRALPGAEACRFVEAPFRLSDHPGGEWWRHVTLPRKLRALSPDLFFAPAYYTPWICPCPIVTAVHDLIVFSDGQTFPPLFAMLLRGAIRASAARSSRLLVASQATVEAWKRHLPASLHKVRVIPDAHDGRFVPWEAPPAEKAAFRTRLGLPRPYVLAVATLEPRKNLATLVEAMGRLHDADPDAPDLVLAGATGWKASPLTRRIEALADAGWLRRLGYVDDEDLPRLYDGAELFCYPSLREGFGIPILEAMACGTPVVTSDRSSMAEVAGGAARLVENPEDPEALARILGDLLRDERERRRLASAGLARARDFSWTRAAAETLDLFEEVVAEGRA